MKQLDLFGNDVQLKTEEAQNKFFEYDKFVEKFEVRHTTDDCFTPPQVYNEVVVWCKENLQGMGEETRILRPFCPNGDYLSVDYSGDCVVIDNPPFSILTAIVKNYNRMGVKYFLFAPHLTCFGFLDKCQIVIVGYQIIYDNKARVNTAFLTNMLNDDVGVIGAPDLRERIVNAQAYLAKPQKRYKYPKEVLTSTMVEAMVKGGVHYTLKKHEFIKISTLDAQSTTTGIFGSGALLSTDATKQRIKCEEMITKREKMQQNRIEWVLSDREKRMQQKLDNGKEERN